MLNLAEYRKKNAHLVDFLPWAALVAPGVVACDNGIELHAPQVLLATGGRTQRPAIDGAELAIDSDGFFALDAAPRRVAVVGAGYIAVELAGVLQALGSHVELFARGRRLLQGFDHPRPFIELRLLAPDQILGQQVGAGLPQQPFLGGGSGRFRRARIGTA